jgi:putative spermidine/putrescine transport system substrate-binding protein
MRLRPPSLRGQGAPRLRVIGRSELVTEPIRARAQADLGFPIDFEMVDTIDGLGWVITRPDSFDVYHQWHTVDLIWTARCIQPIALSRLDRGADIRAAALRGGGPSRGIDTVFDRLFIQPDGGLGAAPSDRISMLPLLHGVDSFGYVPEVRGLVGTEAESWGWLIDPRLRGRVALIGDPVLGLIEAALAVEARREAPFSDLSNLTLVEVDEVIDTMVGLRRLGQFRGTWANFTEAARLVQRGALVQSIFSPGVVHLRAKGLEVVVSTPAEGCRGWHADLCLSAAAEGAALDMAYAYLNWWQTGWAAATLARQGYYATFPDWARGHLDADEWAYWYDGQPAARVLTDPYGVPCIPEGHRREGGSHRERMSRARVWNSFMDEHTHITRRWREVVG